MTGAPFEDVVRSRVLVPAGMHTGTYVADAPGASVRGPRPAPALCRVSAPSGGLWASATDIARLLQVLRAGGGGVLRPESALAMQQAHAPTGTGPHDAYGYGDDQHALAWRHVADAHRIATAVGRRLGPDRQPRFGAVVLVSSHHVPMGAVTRAARLFAGLVDSAPPKGRPVAEWTRYVGVYRDPVGLLGSVAISLDEGRLTMQFAGREPAEGLPPDVTFFPPDGAQAQFLVTVLGVGQRMTRAEP